jgi:hypothetical protein
MSSPTTAVNTAPAALDLQAVGLYTILLHKVAKEAVDVGKAPADGVLILAAYREGEMPINRHFAIGDVDGMTWAAIELGVSRNVYAPLCIMHPADLTSNGKGRESDVAAVLGLCVDGDSDHGHDAPQPPVPANLTIESSSKNLQHFILLSEALPVDEAKQFGRALKRATKADSADDMCHVWRVPGTLNFPGKSKLVRGRSPHPQSVRIVGGVRGVNFTARTDLATLRTALAEHWQDAPAFDPNAPRAPQGEYQNDAEKVRELLQKAKANGYYDLAGDHDTARLRYTRTAKALSYDLGDAAGFLIFRDIVCWRGDRPDQGRAVDAQEAAYRWWDCSRPPKRGKPLTLGSIKGDLEKVFGWPQREMVTERTKSAQEMFAGMVAPDAAGPTPEPTPAPATTIDDFIAFLPSHDYVFVPTGAHWPKESLNATVPPQLLRDANGAPVFDPKTGKPKYLGPAAWLDKFNAVHAESWAPGCPAILENTLVNEGGFEHAPGRRTFNLYRPSLIVPREGDPKPWIEHLDRIFLPEDAAHIIGWAAHRVQRPQDKVNHAIVLGGPPGGGKDTCLEPIVAAVGASNFASIRVKEINGNFNPYARSVILRINEVHDLGDSGFNRFELYEALKIYQAAPPATLRINSKHRQEYYIPNVSAAVMTSNHKHGGMFLPGDDRRHYVAWMKTENPNFEPGYFDKLYAWFANGGNEIVAHYLMHFDYASAGFDPKAPPRKTAAFWEIVGANVTPEAAQMQDTLDRLRENGELPDVITLGDLRNAAAVDADFTSWLEDRRYRQHIPHRLSDCGYSPVRSTTKDGAWVIAGKRQPVYARKELPNPLAAAAELVRKRTPAPAQTTPRVDAPPMPPAS